MSESPFPHSYWMVTSWALGGAFSTLLALPVMEDFGAKAGFLSTYGVMLCFFIPQALARNYATLIIARFFSGGCVSILANTVGSVIGNIWEDERGRSFPITLYAACFLLGSSLGSVVGGVIVQFLSWRWIPWLQLIWYGALLPIYVFFFQECRGSVILRSRARKLRKQGRKAYSREELDTTIPTLPQKVAKSIRRPIFMLATEPVLLVATIWSAFSLGSIYLFTQSSEQVFVTLYGWSASQAGYVQASVAVGILIGTGVSLFNAELYFASAPRNSEVQGVPIPEARLYMSVLGGFVGITGGIFVYGWTSYARIPWIAPAIGLAITGFGTQIVISGIADYITDAYSSYAGSAIAALVFGENTLVAFLPLATESLYTNLSFQWASTLLGLFSLLLSFAPLLVLKWGRNLRARSRFMKEATTLSYDGSLGRRSMDAMTGVIL